MKISIVTPHAVYNYGAVLQAHALYNYLKLEGHEVYMQDFPPHKGGDPASFREKLYVIANSIGRKVHKKEISLGEKKFDEFISEFVLTQSDKLPFYIVGSDQVWNPNNLDEYFSLNFASDEARKIAYAASMGISHLPQCEEERYRKMAMKLDYLSARERQTANEIERVTGRNCSVEIDPTFLLGKEYWKKQERAVNIKKPYVLLYLLHIPKGIKRIVRELKKEYGCEIYMIDRTGFLRYIIPGVKGLGNVGPREFLWLINHAKAVVTTSFHGTAFSLIFETQVKALINPVAPSRIAHLLDIAGIDLQKKEINYQQVTRNLRRHIEASKQYLKKAIGEMDE